MVEESRRKTQNAYFTLLADMGITKHVGSLKATEEMLQLCHIDRNSYILDVGCGPGITPCYLAKTYGCRVAGVDIVPKMIERANELAQRKGVTTQCEFHVGDAQDLPFEDNIFDVVIVESVNDFLPDRPKAFHEYVRVTKPGGYVGVNESTWLERTSGAVDFMTGIGADALVEVEWIALLEEAGLQEIVAHAYPPNIREEAKGRLKRYGMSEMFRAFGRVIPAFFKAESRGVIATAMANAPKHIMKIMGYGVYVGRKTG